MSSTVEKTSKTEESSVNDPHSNHELPEKVIAVLEKVPQPLRDKIISALESELEMVVQETTMRMYNGPTPPPEVLQEIDAIVSGSAREIIDMALGQGNHRREIEKHIVQSQLKESGRGQILGFVIALAFGTFAFILAYTGHEIAGSILGTVDLVALVSIFVLGKLFQHKETSKKKE